MKKGTILIDLDGTAVDTPDVRLPSARLIAATRKLQDDYYICAATGRSQSWAMEVIRPLGLQDPCIVSGGTSILDPVTNQLVWRKSLDSQTTQAVIAVMKQSGQGVVFDNYSEQDYWQGGWPGEVLDTVHEAYFLELIFVPKPVAKAVAEQLSPIEQICTLVIDSQKAGLRDIHIMHKEATKEHAIAQLYQLLDADPSKSIGIGDGHNDLPLFNSVNYKVAMSNSIPAIIAAADKVIGSVKDDGLAAYFEELAGP